MLVRAAAFVMASLGAASAACLDSAGCVDTNPSVNSSLLSSCGAGSFGINCSSCPEGRTTEVWSLQQPGAMGCEYPSDPDEEDEEDEDGEDSDDWVVRNFRLLSDDYSARSCKYGAEGPT